jgi:phosphoglycolate phosphatase-like HAD superfamily hydrolase
MVFAAQAEPGQPGGRCFRANGAEREVFAGLEPLGSIDVVILDFDGTVADTMGFLTDTAVRLLSAVYGMAPLKARRAYIETSGLPFVQQIDIIHPCDARNPATVAQFEKAKQENLLGFHLYPDVIPALEAIRRAGLKVCVSSSNREELIRELIRVRGLEVDLVMGFRPGFEKGRHHFDFARSAFRTRLDRLLFVGDSRRDALTARSAGVKFVMRVGLLGREEIERVLPGVTAIESLDELLPLLGIQKARGTSGSTRLPGPC